MLNQSLNTLYDKEDRTAERAGNAEERLFDSVNKALKNNPNKEWEILNFLRVAKGNVNDEMKETEEKVKNVKLRYSQAETTIRIKSLEKQIDIYYDFIRKIERVE